MSTEQTTTRGLLVAVCGIDASGKTTQAARIAEHLRDTRPVHVARQPTDLYRGDDLVRSVASLDCRTPEALRELALLAAFDLARHARTTIRPRLARGETVIADQYAFPTYAFFQASGLTEMDWLVELNRYAPVPDVTICLDVPAETAASRLVLRGGSLRQKQDIDLRRLIDSRQTYLEQPWGRRTTYHVVDGARPIDDVAHDVLALVDSAAQDLLDGPSGEVLASDPAESPQDPVAAPESTPPAADEQSPSTDENPSKPPRTPEQGTSVLV
ncbi:dTMP kinase [Cellulomonas chengniuliangii]|uniref:Thymidylate kinase n=1 Tax=Cellulomonas chengniuliangii TaxID=2968084 RepID=A0ABY5KZD9_9CELL|nr:dTMP kinase [Cellulomonas chengniuliangii]MCC2309232.1 dTMP kinase [Cellulomonas chengniuliangii]UUI75193.1 dTMP kinase [Cellulomonas chengniuliangii]